MINPLIKACLFTVLFSLVFDLSFWSQNSDSTISTSIDNPIWDTLYDVASKQYKNYDDSLALYNVNKALALSVELSDVKKEIKSRLLLGAVQESLNDKIPAYRNYIKALSKSEKIGNQELVISCYSKLSKFYNICKIFEKSIYYKNKELNLILDSKPVDSSKYMYILYDFEVISFNSNNNQVNLQSIKQVVDYANKTSDSFLKNEALTLYRAHLIEDNKLDELYKFCTVDYPEEIQSMRISDSLGYYRIKSLLYENEGKIDSAYQYLLKVENGIMALSNRVMSAHFYLRFGQFLERQSNYDEAVAKYSIAYKLSLENSYLPYALKAAKQLESLYIMKNDYKSAHKYSTEIRTISDEFNYIVNEDEMLRLEIDKEEQEIKFALEKQGLANKSNLNKQKSKTQLSIWIGALILILALALLSRLRYVRKVKLIIEGQKRRSDNLLLNILPFEVAEELKEKGRSAARSFDNSTVLFTDFIEFTKISEQLNAEELVAEINTCFEGLDSITEEYHIEKIKTIGDAYLAVGGLHENDRDSVRNTVLAALDMQVFIEQRKKTLQEQNILGFEMRCGLHTGPIVAGIVGKKKFQYDIWGDAVNTASRMESCGESGMVNISNDTYQIIKDDDTFEFEARGLIKAKGKGELEMFFVRRREAKL